MTKKNDFGEKNKIETERLPIVQSAKQRTVSILERIEALKQVIEKEIETHGFYPNNDGVLSQKEFCRRAGFSAITLQGKTHKFTTLPMLNDWLASKSKSKKTIGADVRANKDEHFWKSEHEKLAQYYNISEIKAERLEDEIKFLKEKNHELEKANAELVKQLSKIKPLGRY